MVDIDKVAKLDADMAWMEKIAQGGTKSEAMTAALEAYLNRSQEPIELGGVHVGDKVRVVLEGRLTAYNADAGIWKLRGDGAPQTGGHIPWTYDLHWGTDFVVLEEGPRGG